MFTFPSVHVQALADQTHPESVLVVSLQEVI